MLRYVLTLLTAFTFTTISAQHYSGYYVSDPPLEDYHHFKIHQEHHGSELSVKAFSAEHSELWELKAPLLGKAESQLIIGQFADHADIERVYRVSLLMDGTDWEFLLLGYRDHKRDHGAFKVIEEVFEHEGDNEPDLISKFEWYKSHHHAHN